MSSLEHQDSATAQAVRQPARAELVGSKGDDRTALLPGQYRREVPGVRSLDPVAERGFGSLDHRVLLIEWSDPERAVGINDATEIQWEKIDVTCRVADRVWGRA